MSDDLVIFECEVVAVDKPATRRRWNGEPMHSAEASGALNVAVEAFRAALIAEGFTIARTTYGARAGAQS